MRVVDYLAAGGLIALACTPALAQRHVGGRAGMPRCKGDMCRSGGDWVVGIGHVQPNAASRAAHADVITDPVWIGLPVIANHYPERAYEQGIAGAVSLRCLVLIDGTLDDCGVESEAPKNLGFAKAAIEMSSEFRMRTILRNGDSATGKSVTVPVVFKPPS